MEKEDMMELTLHGVLDVDEFSVYVWLMMAEIARALEILKNLERM